jgi:type I site-specific restriction endonuclease
MANPLLSKSSTTGPSASHNGLAMTVSHLAASHGPSREGLNLDSIKDELRRLSAANQELLESFSGREAAAARTVRSSPTETIDRLTQENAELKRRIVDLEGELANLAPESWTEQQREQQRNFEQLLDEKSEIIRTLNHKLQSLTESGNFGGNDYEQEKLQALAADLQARDEQLRADEEAMQMQVREMEMRMSRERAELARQKAQIDRLHSDLERELEVASRDPNLRDRLRSLQRSGDARPRPSTQPSLPARPATPSTLDPAASNSGAPVNESRSVLRRMFGG